MKAHKVFVQCLAASVFTVAAALCQASDSASRDSAAAQPAAEGTQNTSVVPLQLGAASLNGGGVSGAASGVWTMGATVGQSVSGSATTGAWDLDAGFWAASPDTTAPSVCNIVLTGDVNISSALTSADIIYLVNFVFKSQAAPLPCAASGDVNCSGSVTSADIIYMVNHVFKSQAAPCDVCPLILDGTWTCP